MFRGSECEVSRFGALRVEGYRGTSLIIIKTAPPPKGHHKALGIVLLWGPRGGAVSHERGKPVGGRGLPSLVLRAEGGGVRVEG